MATTIAQYYTDELFEWTQSIHFFNEEMNEFKQKLTDIIRRDSIVDIAHKVEIRFNLLNQMATKFYALQFRIEEQESTLKTDNTLVDNAFIEEETENRQVELRRTMHALEKEYIDVKFDCSHFLSETLKSNGSKT